MNDKPAIIPVLKQPERVTCDRLARKGTGHGMCNHPLDDNGQCDRAGDHIEDEFSA